MATCRMSTGPRCSPRSGSRSGSRSSIAWSPGDASPTALAAELGLGSNLMAHHVRVLEDAGVVRRVRSEGDGRRSYIQLRLDNPTVRSAVLPSAMSDLLDRRDLRRVVFVCTANSARSQLAAATWNTLSDVCRRPRRAPTRRRPSIRAR